MKVWKMIFVALLSHSGGALVLVGRIDCGGSILLFGGNRRGVVLLMALEWANFMNLFHL